MDLIVAVVGPTVTLALAWLVGNSLTSRWDAVKKRTELDLAAQEQFYKLYGEFFAVWKLWNDAVRRGDETPRSSLLDRIADSEGQLEALIVRIACQRALTAQQQHIVGAFRQAYQSLRSSMRQSQSLSADLGWNASNAAPYAAFKGLGASVGVLLQPEPASLLARLPGSRASPVAATAALRHMTSNAYEPWIAGGEQHVVWEAVARNQGLLDVAEESPPPLAEGSPYYHPDAVYPKR